ncbi:AMP-dependent synthetase/ligase [Streptomyces sp. ACA25]|uniref:AMP-dependent synthetase/ligase n=1 Tax=Streptomyces sp. ACA25 TaxID=3022596 RepID=UPI00230766BC|nr:AMP-dependent synthetase/ligase [Streptomyces sp. ACA25]MDB1089910.1 AMP-dependent synthetase/ligase [Streptomyces sp. ACA25]
MREFGLPALYQVSDESSLPQLLHRNAARHPDEPVVSHRQGDSWQDIGAAAFLDQVRQVAKGLMASGVEPGDRVGLMSRTRYEWTLLDFAIWSAGAVTVPVYETSSAEQVAWILQDSGAVACVVETQEHAETVASVRARLPGLTRLWRITAAGDEAAVPLLTAAGREVTDEALRDVEATVSADSVATLIYTSGTTGRPKGCVLSHRAFLAECGNVVEGLKPLFRTGESSVLLFLPQAHVFARMVEVTAALAPIRLGHVPDARTLTDDLSTFRPTIILAVPRVFEKVYNGARAKAQEDGKAKIFDRAADTAVAYSRALDAGGPGRGLKLRHALFDRLVYRKLRAVLGGRATHAISGGAPLGERLGHFYRGIGFTVLEGYGLTETCGATAFNPHDAPKVGTVGRPLPGSSVRIGEDNEVLVTGEHLFTGYWNNESATADSMEDGWYRTGDIGSLDDEGYLTIGGRKKEILVTAAGKNVSPAVIEDGIRSHELVAECMVVGDGRPFVAALVTVDDEFLPRWAENHDLADRPREELLQSPELLAAVQEAVDRGNSAVSRAESVRKFRILPEQFSEESGHLTPSMKLKRHAVAKDYSEEIEALYRK